MSKMPQRTRYLKLPFQFDIPRLATELKQVVAIEWIRHFNTADYENGWSCVPLRSVDGRTDHIMSVEGENFLDTDILKRCAYFQEVLNQFHCEKTSVRLMALEAGGVIKPHTDSGTSFEDGLARLHIPILTDPQIQFVIDGEAVHFACGHAWYLNAACVHAVANTTQQPRVHLMLDCLPNPWLRRVFDEAGFIPNDTPRYPDPSINDDNVLEIIECLRGLGTAASMRMVEELAAIHAGSSRTDA